MESIKIGGVDYLPASALAKKFGYTSDYIGQLCRGKKVDAQLVGRSWYVNPISLSEHKKGRYSNTKVAPETIKPKVKVTAKVKAVAKEVDEHSYKVAITRRNVEAPIRKSVAKLNLGRSKEGSQAHAHHFSKRIDWKPIEYQADESDLMPSIKAYDPVVKINEELARSTDITIKSASKVTMLVADPLPEVFLKGKLKVSSLDEEVEDKVSYFPEIEIPTTALPAKPVIESSPVKALHHTLSRTSTIYRSETRSSRLSSLPQAPVSFVPASVAKENITTGFDYLKAALFTLVGVLGICLFLLFFSESSILATADSANTLLNFSTESFSTLYTFFSR